MRKEVKLKGARVLFLCTTDNMIWQFLIPHVKDLIACGAKVDCVCHKTGFWFDDLKDKFDFNMIELGMKRSPLNLTNLRAYKSLKKLHKEKGYDLIYCQQPTGGMLGRFLGKKFRVPVIYTAHGFFFYKGGNALKNCIFKHAEKYMAKYTDILITMNDEDFEACKNWKADRKYNIHGIGLDLGKYEKVECDKNAFKAQLGIKSDEKIVLSVSEFIKRKNYPTMLRTVAELLKERKDFKYVACGTGVLQEEMKAYARELGIEKNVLFLGYRKDINMIMQASDIMFHESFHEGLTMSIMEAMHFDLPVVTSNVRGNKDLIDENGGFVTEPTDIEAQKNALNKLLDNENLRREFGEHNKKKSQLFSLENVRNELHDIYAENNLIEK